MWNDEFEGNTLDRSNWNVELHEPGWVNSELQAYVDSEDNIKVEDGVLKLIPVETVTGLEGKQELLSNSDFSNGMEGWTETIANWDETVTANAQSSIANNAITYTIVNPGTENWHVQLKQSGLSLQPGITYHMSFVAQSDVDRTIITGVQNGVNYTGYVENGTVQLTANVPQTVSFDVTVPSADNKCELFVSMGKTDASTPDLSTITLSDFSFSYEATGQATKSYTSGRINTQNKNTFTYGYFECRAKVPEGAGYLPAFWLMANDENVYGQWPRCGEIDCMEVMGQDPSKIYGTIHFGNPHSESQGTKVLENDSFASGYHTFGCEWIPGKISWYVDGVKFHEESDWYSTTEGLGTLSYPAPFDQPFYVILNLAIGGSWVGNPTADTTYGEQNAYTVDYVRVYQLDEYDENVTRPEQQFNPREPDAEGNYVINGSFATVEDLDDNDAWMFRLANEGDALATINNGVATVTTSNPGNVDYSIQLMQAALPFQKGATYQISYEACASEARTMNVDVKAPDHGYKTYMTTQKPSLTNEWQTFTHVFKMTSDSDENGRLEFNMGAMDSTADVQIANVSVKKIADPDPNEKEQKTVLSNGNYVYNGNFQEGTGHLGYWTVSDPADAVSVTNLKDGRRLQATAPVTIFQDELAFTEGTAYALSFDAQAQNAGDTVKVIVGGQEFTATLGTESQTYSFKIPSSTRFANSDLSVEFNGTGTIWFDNVMLCEDSMIKNGSFNNGLTGYEVYVANDANASYVVDSLNEDNALDVTVNNTADADWKIQIKQNNVNLEEGKTYRLSFRAKSTMERPIRVVLQGLEPLGWPVYSSDNVVTLTSDYQTFTDEFTMTAATDPAAFLSICLGKVGDFQTTDQHRVVLDDFKLELVVPEPEPITISKKNVTVNAGKLYYNGKARKPAVTVTVNGQTLTKNVDYTVSYKNNKYAGTASVTVTGKGAYTGTATRTFKIYKASNTLKAGAKTIKLSAAKLAKKGTSIKRAKAFVVKEAKGKVTYKKSSGNAKITVSKAGTVSVKKGLKKGTYKVKVNVTAAGSANYKAATKTVTLKVVVTK